MDTDQSQSLTIIQDDTYLKIWQAEQEWTRNRGITTTFFMSVSFAILGLSLQAKLTSTQYLAVHFYSLLIYWFAYVLFLHTHDYTKLLRTYLKDMEISGRTTLDLEKRTEVPNPKEETRSSVRYTETQDGGVSHAEETENPRSLV